MSDSVRPHKRQPTRLPRPWDSPGKNTGVGCHFLLQGIFLTQGSNPSLLHWQALDWEGASGLRMEELEWGWGELVWARGARLGMGGAPRVLRHLGRLYQSEVPLLSYF